MNADHLKYLGRSPSGLWRVTANDVGVKPSCVRIALAPRGCAGGHAPVTVESPAVPILESSPSGLWRRPGKLVGIKPPREFESRTLCSGGFA